jgi:hypothetical protein
VSARKPLTACSDISVETSTELCMCRHLPIFSLVTLLTVGPILAQMEAYVDLWCSCQIGDVYIDLSIHLFDTYTSKVNAAPPLTPNPMPRDDRTQSPLNTNHLLQLLLHSSLPLGVAEKVFLRLCYLPAPPAQTVILLPEVLQICPCRYMSTL